jgi:hypothetical protein
MGSITVVVLVSAIAGALTPLGEQYLPRSIQSMANSSGSWTLIAFAAVYASRVRSWRAAAMGAMAFLVMNAVFEFVYGLRGYEYPHHYLAFWDVIAVAVGPLVGLSASWLRSTSPGLRAIAVAAPSAVLIGEGFYMLVDLPGNSTLYALASVLVGVVLFLFLAELRLQRLAPMALSAAMCAIGAVAFFTIYGLLPLVLDKVVP